MLALSKGGLRRRVLRLLASARWISSGLVAAWSQSRRVSTGSDARLPWLGGSATHVPSPPLSRPACRLDPERRGPSYAGVLSVLVSAEPPKWIALVPRGHVSIVGRPAGWGRGTRPSRHHSVPPGCLHRDAVWHAKVPLQHPLRFQPLAEGLHPALWPSSTPSGTASAHCKCERSNALRPSAVPLPRSASALSAGGSDRHRRFSPGVAGSALSALAGSGSHWSLLSALGSGWALSSAFVCAGSALWVRSAPGWLVVGRAALHSPSGFAALQSRTPNCRPSGIGGLGAPPCACALAGLRRCLGIQVVHYRLAAGNATLGAIPSLLQPIH
eukprot:6488808-Amphidinium_carterae.3